MEKEISQILEEKQIPYITLSVPSMLNEEPNKIRLEIDLFNKLIDYLIENGKQYLYITAEQNDPISYDELMILEDIVTKSKQEIQLRGAKTSVEKARVIEHIIAGELPTTVRFGDEDFYTSCDKNLIQSIKEKKGDCCHFAALTQYVHYISNISTLTFDMGDIDKKLDIIINYVYLSTYILYLII